MYGTSPMSMPPMESSSQPYYGGDQGGGQSMQQGDLGMGSSDPMAQVHKWLMASGITGGTPDMSQMDPQIASILKMLLGGQLGAQNGNPLQA